MTTPRSIAASVAAAALSFVGACATELDDASDADVVLDATAVIDDGVIVGSLDWIEASTLTGIARTAANASGYVSIPQKSSRCSGFLISRDIVMTNHHCIPDAASAVGVIVNFKYETSWDNTGVVACDQFIGANADLDYALVRCTGTPGDTYGFLTVDPSALATGKSIQLLHQQCDYATTPSCEPTKKLSPGKVTATTRIADRITHDADMLGGSSGGAIIAPGTTNVIAINNAHYVPNGSTDFRGTTNIGVPMSLIVPDMQQRFPQLFANCESIPAAGRVIDEDDDCTTLGGESRFWRSIEGNGHDGDLVWTGTTANSTVGNSAEWALKFAAAGRYDLAVYVDATYGTATRARYTVRHAGGSTDVVVNQDAVGSSGFVALGSFQFAAGSSGSVRLNDNTGDRSQQLVVDALRVSPTGAQAAPTPPAATCTQVRITGAETLNVRPTPNTTQAPVGVLRGGDVVTRTSSVTGSVVRGTDVWYGISGQGLTGYISASYATCVN